MPLYEYQCASCEKIHEAVQKFSDAPLTECPDCKGALSKLISMSSFALKGTGWYATDYKRAPSKPGQTGQPTAAAGGEKAAGAPAAGKPADSKTAAKATETAKA